MSIETSLSGYYARRAREYERIYDKPERQEDLRWLRDYVQRAFAGARVFEIACGTGYWTEVVAASVIATDINEEVLAIARSKPIAPGTVEFRTDDAYFPKIDPARFTGGLSAFWWSHVPKARLDAFLRSFHRVLSPGARVIFLDNAYVEGSSTPISRADERGNTYQIRRLDDGSTHEVLKNFPAESDLRAAVETVADDVEVVRLRYYWLLNYVTKT
jgi:ubiquinone/menaquinone biosynthesis C-methylase UbiE